jgi:hypothetical protein
MRIKALQDFHSPIVTMRKDEIRVIELDDYTFENWVANGLIVEVKLSGKKSVSSDENK